MAENPQAFPWSEWRNTSSDPLATPREIRHPGLSMRDWFAGQALAGLCANPELLKQMPGTLRMSKGFASDDIEGAYANMARKFADALLAQRERDGVK
jgi:hypothetical protein